MTRMRTKIAELVVVGNLEGQRLERKRQKSTGNPERALHSYVVLYMLLLTRELCKDGEHACALLLQWE